MKTMTPKAAIGLLILALTLVFQFSSDATSYADPKPETIKSTKGKNTQGVFE